MQQKKSKVKICVSSTGRTLDSQVNPRFGRCQYFLIVDIDDKQILNSQAVANEGATQEHGAGIKAAQQVGELGVNVVITGDLGPKAGDALNQLGIQVYSASGTAEDAVNKFIKEELNEINETNSMPKSVPEQKDSANEKIFFPLLNNAGEDSEISSHFGHAPFFGLYNTATKEFTVTENKIDHHGQFKSPVDQIIEIASPTTVFAQSIGGRAISLFAEKGVGLKTGPYRTVKEVIDNLDKLEDLTEGCRH